MTACSVGDKRLGEEDEAIIESAISSDEDEEPLKEGDGNFHARRIQRTFRQRIREYKKKEMRTMTLKDRVSFRDP